MSQRLDTVRQLRASLQAILIPFMALSIDGCCRCDVPPGPSPRVIPADTTVSKVDRAANSAPVLEPLYAEEDGRKIRIIRAGATVTVRARASDPDGDAVWFRWELSSQGGSLDRTRGPVVQWRVGERDGPRELRVLAYDGRGGSAERRLLASEDTTLVFSGRVLTPASEPVESASVTVGGIQTYTARDGSYRLEVYDTELAQYVVNIEKPGFGLISRVFDGAVEGAEWTTRPATVVSVDPTQPIVVRDNTVRAYCPGPKSGEIDWARFPKQRIARVFRPNGDPWTGPLPNEALELLGYLETQTPCGPGITVAIPSNSLVDANGQPPPGNVQVALTTVDLYSPDAMPGNFTVRVAPDSAIFMESYGAGTVEITANGRSYHLEPDAVATITIPVDSIQLQRDQKLPRTIPFLRYDRATGVWVPDGIAELNPGSNAYIATVTRLSEFNTDLLKTNPSCVKINSDAIEGNYELEVTINLGNGGFQVRHYPVDQINEGTLHAVINLPNDTWIALVPIQEDDNGDPVPLGTFVVNSDGPQSPSQPNPPTPPYGQCRSEVALSDVGGDIEIVVDGEDDRVGILPVHIANLVNVSASPEDIYPVGDDDLNGDGVPCNHPQLWPEECQYFFTYFDTGAEIVRVDDATATRLKIDGLAASDPLLNVSVRINGLAAVDETYLYAPIFAHGTPSGAQAERNGVRVGVRTCDPGSPQCPTLIGSPVANNVLALIDNTKWVSRGPYCSDYTDPSTCAFQEGPDITFFMPGDAGIPVPELDLTLERFAPFGGSSASQGDYYLLRNVTFENSGSVVSDDPTAPEPYTFFYDTGTSVTIINNGIARDLGLIEEPTPGVFNILATITFPCLESSHGFTIERIVMAGGGGQYAVRNANVCWSENDIEIKLQSGEFVDAVIGSNLFMQVPVLFDGPGNKLGVGVAGVPIP